MNLNVSGLGSPSKVNLLCRELEFLSYNIFLLQENHISCKKQAKSVERAWRGKCFWSFGVGKSAGVAVFLSPNFSGFLQCFVSDSDGRVLSLLFQFNSFKLNVINIYPPNGVSDHKTFFEQLHHHFRSQGDFVIAGDFNCVDCAIDKFHSKYFHSSDKTCLAALKTDFSLVDVYRKLNRHGISFTWSNSSNTQASRLDWFFISHMLFKSVSVTDDTPHPKH